MTIDDELILEFIKPDAKGRITERSLIAKIVGTNEISYRLEHSTYYIKTYGSGEDQETEIVKITPDITIKMKPKKGLKAAIKDAMKQMAIGPEVGIAFELENDYHWDFQESLRQLKKYRDKFKDTRIIIPDDFKRFAPLYKHEGFRVYLWKAKRIWQCLRCGTETVKEGPVAPECSRPDCKNRKQDDFRLIGLKDTTITEFAAPEKSER